MMKMRKSGLCEGLPKRHFKESCTKQQTVVRGNITWSEMGKHVRSRRVRPCGGGERENPGNGLFFYWVKAHKINC